ncbi:MAG TPA: ABC transporter permease [Phycisphaerales bacterium]|nr:ABC transporter permease [Phycisphaerales bacterium]
MNKVFMVAWREFSTTVFTKAFILGIVMMPVMILIVGGAVAWLKNQKGPQIEGTVAVIDRSGLVASRVRERFSEDSATREAKDTAKAVSEQIQKSPVGKIAGATGGAMEQGVQQAIEQAAAQGPKLTLELLPADADVEKEKEPVKVAEIKTRKKDDAATTPAAPPRLALLVIPETAVTRPAEGGFGTIEGFFAQRLDGEIQSRIERRVQEAVVDARLENEPRLNTSGLKPQDVRELVTRPKTEAKTLTKTGEKSALGELTMLVPMGFMILMMVSVMTSGSSLLTTTVEEKSNRVMEVLLSAVSPMQLMGGKILGQMGVGLLMLGIYSGAGIGALVFFLQRMDLVTTEQLIYVFIFFLIEYFLIASLFAAIGSAVNDMREAQTLMGPIMLLIMLPWMIWFVIQRAPNSPLAVALSFVPGMNPFIMVIRICGSEPVPTWQIPVAIGVGVLSVIFAAWAAAKVFRVGALMYGKPPDFKTLVRWIRMA